MWTWNEYPARIKLSPVPGALAEIFNVTDSELTGEKLTWPATNELALGLESFGQFNTTGPPGVEAVKLTVAVPVTPQVIDIFPPLMVG
jgi:hypothetical protein